MHFGDLLFPDLLVSLFVCMCSGVSVYLISILLILVNVYETSFI